jgi:Na+-driven multidrug efflux pump
MCRCCALLRVSLTGILQFAIANASWIGLVRIVSLFGSAAVAGYTVAIRIVIFFILPAWGLSNAAATLVGQNLGAGIPNAPSRRSGAPALQHAFLGGRRLLHRLRHAHRPPLCGRPGSRSHRRVALRTSACGNIGYAYGMVMLQAFNGAGDTLTPTIVNFFGFWVLEIPLAYWLASCYRTGRRPFLRPPAAECRHSSR